MAISLGVYRYTPFSDIPIWLAAFFWGCSSVPPKMFRQTQISLLSLPSIDRVRPPSTTRCRPVMSRHCRGCCLSLFVEKDVETLGPCFLSEIFVYPSNPLYIVGGIPTPLTNMKVSWDDGIPNIWKNNYIPNHQPASISQRTMTMTCCSIAYARPGNRDWMRLVPMRGKWTSLTLVNW